MKKTALLALALLWVAVSPSVMAQTTKKPDEKIVADAYVYLLGRALAIRQEHIDRGGQGFAYNTIK